MDRDKALERVLRLVALALDPSQIKDGAPSEEARTAAWKACRVLHEHRLLAGGTADHAPSAPRAEAPAPRPEKRKKARSWSQAWKPRPSPSPKTSSAADDPEPRDDSDPASSASAPSVARRGTFGRAKFHGQCLYCGFVIHKGDEIYFMPGFGSDHKDCAMKRAGLEVE